jgi:hypothetical protein
MEAKRKRVSTKGLSERVWLNGYPKGFGTVYRAYLQGALRRKCKFTLSVQEVFNLVCKPCYYCGREGLNHTLGFDYNGIDKIDANEGYVINNVVPCCKDCNVMKRKMLIHDFLQQVERISEYGKKNKK